MWNGDWSWGGMLLMALTMLFFWGGLIWLVVYLLKDRLPRDSPTSNEPPTSSSRSASQGVRSTPTNSRSDVGCYPGMWRRSHTIRRKVRNVSSNQRPVAWIPTPSPEELPKEVAAEMKPISDRIGFVPNIARLLAVTPQHFVGWWRYFDELMRGPSGLSKTQREMIAVVVSVEARCPY